MGVYSPIGLTLIVVTGLSRRIWNRWPGRHRGGLDRPGRRSRHLGRGASRL